MIKRDILICCLRTLERSEFWHAHELVISSYARMSFDIEVPAQLPSIDELFRSKNLIELLSVRIWGKLHPFFNQNRFAQCTERLNTRRFGWWRRVFSLSVRFSFFLLLLQVYEPRGQLLVLNVLTKDTVAVLSSMVVCITFLEWSKRSVLSPRTNPSQSLQKGESTSVT